MAYISASIVSEACPLMVALATIFVLLTASLLVRRGKRRRNFPPGPPAWPVIGNLHQLGERPNETFAKLSKIYGPVMQVKFGSSNVVVIDTPEMAKEFLKTYDSNFASRPKLAAGKYITYEYSGMIWGAYGHHWRQGRRILLTHLFHAKRQELYEYVRVEESKEFMRRLYESRGKALRIKENVTRMNLSIISRIVLGRKYFSGLKVQNEEPGVESVKSLDELQMVFHEFFLLNGAVVIGDWIPWLAWLDLGGYVKRMKKLRQKFDKFFDAVIEDHLEARAGHLKEGHEDMMDILLDHYEDPDPENRLTMNNVKGFTMDLLTGGTDTSSTINEWGMAELMRNPEKMKKAKEELNRVIGPERWAGEKDIPNLPYIEAIMKEAMRLHPASVMLTPHYAMEDCQVQNYNISKGSLVFINAWSIGRHPKVWDCPEEFRPERYFEKDVDYKGQGFELLPFGAGRRMCPGYSLGLKLLMTSLANLIHGFNWKLPNGMKPEDLNMEDVYGLASPMKYPLMVVPEPCLAPHLYA